MFSWLYLGLRIIKIKTILTIFYSYSGLLQPFFSSKSQSLAFRKELNDKSSNVDSIKCIQCFKFMLFFWKKTCAQQCLPQFLWHGRHFGTCKSMGSSPMKMSTTLRSSASTFYMSTERLTCLNFWNVALLRLRRDLFIILSRFLAGSCSEKMSQVFHDPSINLRMWKGAHV